MKIILFSGFLGSGKTSGLLSLIEYLKPSRPDKIVVVENEIGGAGIDNEIISAQGYEVKGLYSGCVCCTLAGDFVECINQIHTKLQPEYVLFEPTGVAYPARIKAIIEEDAGKICGMAIVTIIDAHRFRKLLKITPDLISRQMKAADLILINKCDLVEQNEIDYILREVELQNSEVAAFPVSIMNGIDTDIWEVFINVFF